MGRTMAVRGPGRRRPRQLPVLSFAASQVYTAARGSRSLAVGAVSDHQGELYSQGDPRSHRADFCEAAAAFVAVAGPSLQFSLHRAPRYTTGLRRTVMGS